MSRVLNYISNRRSALAFEPKPISDSEIELLIDAARWAPSSFNEQPWRFFYASRSNEESFNKLLSTLAPGNSEWAIDSSLLIITTAKKTLTLNGRDNGYALHDVGLATANLLIQAESMGLVTHVMGGFDKDVASTVIGISDDYIPVSTIAVGYSGDISKLSESNQKRAKAERRRKGIDEISKRII